MMNMGNLTKKFTAGLLFTASILISGCTHSSTRTIATAPGLSQAVRVSSGDTDAAEPAIAASPDGVVYVAWVNHAPKSQADVMIARFKNDGQIAGPAVRVNLQPGIATAWRGDPPTVAVAPDKTVFVGWTARVESEAGQATNFYVSSSRDQGRTFSAPGRSTTIPNPLFMECIRWR
jgi:hypothetical protein